jgi:hypothetical protein
MTNMREILAGLLERKRQLDTGACGWKIILIGI